jgi:hypothetical protein
MTGDPTNNSEVALMPLAQRPLHIYFGHHKAATSWVIKILSDLGHLNSFDVTSVDTASDLHTALLRRRHDLRRSILAYRNADPNSLETLEPFVGIHIIRDPRDIAVSSYFSHLHSHPTDNWPELAAHKRRLALLDQFEGLLCDMEFCRDLLTRGHVIEPYRCMADWDYDRSDVLELRYEKLIVNPYDVFIRVFHFFDLLSPDELGARALVGHLRRILVRRLLPQQQRALPKLHAWNILASVYDNRYEKKTSGRAPGTEDPRSHYRKGVAGDWRNYFQPEHKQRFKELYGDILVRLQYEPNGSW